MEKALEKDSIHSNIVHVMSNEYVRIVDYDQRMGQVSYTLNHSNTVYTCFDYELVSLKGIDHLRVVLSSAANNNPFRNISPVMT